MCVLPSLPEVIVSKVDLNFPLTALFGLIDATFLSCLRTDMKARSFSPQERLDFLSYPGFLVRKNANVFNNTGGDAAQFVYISKISHLVCAQQSCSSVTEPSGEVLMIIMCGFVFSWGLCARVRSSQRWSDRPNCGRVTVLYASLMFEYNHVALCIDPAGSPASAFLSSWHLHCLADPKTTYGEPGGLIMSTGML